MIYSGHTSFPPPLPDEPSAGLALLGHDVRAAVSDIIGGLRLVPTEALDAEIRAQLERARVSGEDLARLLDEGMALISGQEPAPAADGRVSMAGLLADLRMRWGGRARERGLDFRLTVAPDVPKALSLDRVALDRVLSNMLSNAMKYTQAGRVEVDLRLSPTGGLLISVTDQGPGFSAQAMARLFDYGGRPEDSGQPGQGLGLHIGRAMCDRLGGRISAGNLAGGGARVLLELPPACWRGGEADGRPADPLPDLSGLRVLVADDTATNRALLAQMLARMGAACQTAADGFEALDHLLTGRFDLVLVDIEMPHLPGTEVIRWLKAGDTPHPAVPVVAITAHVLRANRDAIHLAGADAILPKPFGGIEGLAMTLDHILSGAALRPGAEPSDKPAPALESLIRAAGPAEGRELLHHLAADLAEVRRGLSGGLDRGDARAVRAATHVLIPLAGAAGAAGLLTLARRLNLAAHRGDGGGMAAQGPEVLAQVSRLIAAVETEQSRHGAA